MSTAVQKAMSILSRGRSAAQSRFPRAHKTAGYGLLAAGVATPFAAVGYGAYRMEQSFARANEADVMTRMILTAQSGPFGPAGKMMGIMTRGGNTAGLTLAAHYARNRNKAFGVLGLNY